MMDISAEVRAELARRRLSWRDLALKAGIPYSSLHRRLSTGRDWRLNEVVLICDCLGLPLGELLERSQREAVA